jgi:hypothetical protein
MISIKFHFSCNLQKIIYHQKNMKNDHPELGPLGALVGTWEGDKGKDISPDPKLNTETNLYRERMVFEPTGMVNNHSQTLYGLRYSTKAWRIGEPDPFHEELGYWLWDAERKQVLRCFMVPRGVTIIAGGTSEANASSFSLEAEVGNHTYGICSNQFLDENFKTVKYTLKVEIKSDGKLSYEEDTVLKIKGKAELFHHTDKNTLNRV